MYLITGATGNVGSELAKELLAQGEAVRIFVRDPLKVEGLKGKVEVAVGDFTKTESFQSALTGVHGVFLMNRSIDLKSLSDFLSAGTNQGVKKVVYLSTLAASAPDLTIGQMHKEQEDVIRASGVTTKILRPGGFMSNAFGWIGSIKSEGKVYNAMGAGRFAPVAPADIAAVAARALTPDLSEEIFSITGGEPTNVREQVSILSEVLHKDLECVDIPEEAAVSAMVKNGIPENLAAAVVQSFRDIRLGKDTPIFDTVERITGRKPIHFRAWAEANANRFA